MNKENEIIAKIIFFIEKKYFQNNLIENMNIDKGEKRQIFFLLELLNNGSVNRDLLKE